MTTVGCTLCGGRPVLQVSHEVHTTLDSLQSQLYSTTRSPELPSRSEYAKYSALHCTALHCTALHCTALHCTALHCPPIAAAGAHPHSLRMRANPINQIRHKR